MGLVKAAIFGGTFNPVHNGHLGIARSILDKGFVDRIYFVPTYHPPHKQVFDNISYEHRRNMLSIALRSIPNVSIKDWERQRKGVSYTIDTLEQWMREDSRSEKYMIVGSDTALELMSWVQWKKIIRNVKLIVFSRVSNYLPQLQKCLNTMYKNLSFNETSQSTEKDFLDRIEIIGDRIYPISSSLIRRQIRQRLWSQLAIPVDVKDYIQHHSLY